MLDDLTTDCPECGGTVRYSLQDVSRERTVRCNRGHRIQFKDDGGGAAKADKALRDLDKSLKSLNRTFKI